MGLIRVDPESVQGRYLSINRAAADKRIASKRARSTHQLHSAKATQKSLHRDIYSLKCDMRRLSVPALNLQRGMVCASKNDGMEELVEQDQVHLSCWS